MISRPDVQVVLRLRHNFL